MTITGTASSTNITSVFQGEYGRAGNIKRYQRHILDRFEQKPTYFQFQKIINNRLETTNYDCWLLDDRNSYDEIIPNKKLVMKPGQSITQGEVIMVSNLEKRTWIVLSTESCKIYHETANIRDCNIDLEFTNDVGANVSIPCVYMDKSGKVTENKYMQLGANQRAIIIQDNDETKKFVRDQEFLLDGLIYRISSLDRLTDVGVVFITLDEYQEGSIVTHTYTLNIQEDNISFMIGETKQLNVVVREDDTIISRPIVYTSSDTTIATVGDNGLVTGVADGTTVITARLRDNESISDTVNIEITSTANDNIEYRFRDTDSHELIVYDTNEYQFNKFNNDVIEPTNFVFSIDYGTSPTDIATLDVVDGNNVRVIANSNQVYGSVELIATEGSDERGRFEINIVSLWG